jgi:serine/threonine protein kinase
MPPTPPIREYPAGQIIPGTVYKVLRHIATGGMGTVYDVEDTSVGKRYVLKTLHPELGDRQDLARRIIKEARTLAQLHHPNIVEVFTAGMTKDDLRLPYYVMERLDGQSLRTVLEKRKSLELLHAYEIGIDLLDALECAHDKAVIHRDVKPDNIFLHRSPNGATVTKLLDFGIMRVLDRVTKGETAGRFLGTLRYAAPEQLRGDAIGPHTDLYAAGLVLYEMLAGRGPFDEETDVHEIGKAHIGRPAPRLSTVSRVPVPPDLEALIASALEKEPAARPRDATAFSKALRALAHAQNPHHGHGVNTTSRPTAIDVLGAHSRMHEPRSSAQQAIGAGGAMYAATTGPAHAPTARSPQAPSPSSTARSPVGGTPRVTLSIGLEQGRTIRGMTPPTLQGGTLEDAPVEPSMFSGTGSPVSVPATLASAGAAPSSRGPSDGVDRRASTRTHPYEMGPGTPQNGTEALVPPIAISTTADPYGRTQRVLESVPPPPPVFGRPPSMPAPPPVFGRPPSMPAPPPVFGQPPASMSAPPAWGPRGSAPSGPPSAAARMAVTGARRGDRAYRIVGIISAIVAVVSLTAVVVLLVRYRARLRAVNEPPAEAHPASSAPDVDTAAAPTSSAAPPTTGVAPADAAPTESAETQVDAGAPGAAPRPTGGGRARPKSSGGAAPQATGEPRRLPGPGF